MRAKSVHKVSESNGCVLRSTDTNLKWAVLKRALVTVLKLEKIMFSDTCTLWRNLTMLGRIRLLLKSYLVRSDITERYDIRYPTLDNTVLLQSWSVFGLQVIKGTLA